MLVDKFCTSCQKVSKAYIHPVTGKINKFCRPCYENLTKSERDAREFKYILSILKDMDVKDKL